MFTYYFQGLALGAAMILPLGPQNAFVMNQGIRRQYHLMIALLCAVSDLLLICAGIFGGSALLMQSPWLLALLAAWLAPRLRTARAQRIINIVVGAVMWFIAFQLAREGVSHIQALLN